MEQMEQVKNSYEGMFLVDAGQPSAEVALEPVRSVLERSEAEILSIKPWEERRLAYEIQGRKRGLYVLSYFRLDAEKVSELEHDCMLNEKILRMLVLRKETVTEAELQASTPAEVVPTESSAGREEDEKAPEDAARDDEDSQDDSDNNDEINLDDEESTD
ncbi:MAG: 30S ribosomal protein S6 [Phycisphaerae bacterium]|nr:30S ribosomal protein S6 [Phycisphaerae bacterium]